jgi:hypothetical protein
VISTYPDFVKAILAPHSPPAVGAQPALTIEGREYELPPLGVSKHDFPRFAASAIEAKLLALSTEGNREAL